MNRIIRSVLLMLFCFGLVFSVWSASQDEKLEEQALNLDEATLNSIVDELSKKMSADSTPPAQPKITTTAPETSTKGWVGAPQPAGSSVAPGIESSGIVPSAAETPGEVSSAETPPASTSAVENWPTENPKVQSKGKSAAPSTVKDHSPATASANTSEYSNYQPAELNAGSEFNSVENAPPAGPAVETPAASEFIPQGDVATVVTESSQGKKKSKKSTKFVARGKKNSVAKVGPDEATTVSDSQEVEHPEKNMPPAENLQTTTSDVANAADAVMTELTKSDTAIEAAATPTTAVKKTSKKHKAVSAKSPTAVSKSNENTTPWPENTPVDSVAAPVHNVPEAKPEPEASPMLETTDALPGPTTPSKPTAKQEPTLANTPEAMAAVSAHPGTEVSTYPGTRLAAADLIQSQAVQIVKPREAHEMLTTGDFVFLPTPSFKTLNLRESFFIYRLLRNSAVQQAANKWCECIGKVEIMEINPQVCLARIIAAYDIIQKGDLIYLPNHP